MSSRSLLQVVFCAALPAACAGMTCDASMLDSVLGDLLGNRVTIVVENETAYTAAPDLRAGKSRSFFEDILEGSDPLDAAGSVPAHQTRTFSLPCNGDFETVVYDGVAVRDVNGFPLGAASASKVLRRDLDFDCGDRIRIRIEGGILNFHTQIDVERSAGADPLGLNRPTEAGPDDEIARLLDELFN